MRWVPPPPSGRSSVSVRPSPRTQANGVWFDSRAWIIEALSVTESTASARSFGQQSPAVPARMPHEAGAHPVGA